MQPVRHDTLARTLALDRNNQVIGVTGKAVSVVLQLQIELVTCTDDLELELARQRGFNRR